MVFKFSYLTRLKLLACLLVPCLLMYEAMKHIAVTRLLQMCTEAVVQDEQEEAHLMVCQDCRMLLRAFAEDRVKYEQNKSYYRGNGKDFSKSA